MRVREKQRWRLTLRSRRALVFLGKVLLGFDQSESDHNVELIILAILLQARPLLQLFWLFEISSKLRFQRPVVFLRQSEQILFAEIFDFDFLISFFRRRVNLVYEALQTFI